MTVEITVSANCPVTMPSLSTDSVLLDGFTYVFGEDPLQLSFTGLVSDCSVLKNVLLKPSLSAIDTSVFTFTQGAVDVLSVQTNDPDKEGLYSLQYVVYFTSISDSDA